MLYPSIDKLLKKTSPNRFKLVIAASKRARDIDDGKVVSNVENADKKKSISTALEELESGTISITPEKK